MKRIHIILWFASATFLVAAVPSRVQEIATRLQLKVAQATRTSTPPVIDGVVDDPQWFQAPPVEDFLQIDPLDLAPPSEKTEVRILYDDVNLYIAFRNFESHPGEITGRMTRRDDWMRGFSYNSDWVGVGFDSKNDDQTGYLFNINAAGVKLDVYVSKDRQYDLSWDTVWEGHVSRDSLGWYVEMEIPFSVLQFSTSDELVWGVRFERSIYQLQETVQWPGRPKGTQGLVSRFGILTGLKNVPSPRRLEILPYLLAGQDNVGQSGFTNNIGLDLKYGLASSTTANVTFNPDFGQVEADPSVLNLTAFETFFEEKRPFFVEGGSFFQNRIQLFHSRRIGKRPGFFTPNEGQIISQPAATKILGAVKIMGQTEQGLSFGVIESVTDREYGVLEKTVGDTVQREQFLLEPYFNYFIGRIEQPLFNTNSNVGLMVTDAHPQGAQPATVVGSDWNLNFLDNALAFSGQLAVSNHENKKGTAFRFFLGYKDPKWWELNTGFGFTDARFEINDLGFMTRNNAWWSMIRGGIRKQDPWGRYLNNNLSVQLKVEGRGDGLILSRSIDANQTNNLKNYWSFGLGFHFNFAAFNDNDTFKDPRAWAFRTEDNGYAYIWVQSDRRRNLTLKPMVGIGRGEFRGWGYRVGLTLTWKPSDNIQFNVDATQDLTPSSMEWVGIVEASTDTSIIYAESEQLTDDIRLRLNWAFTPDLSLEMFLQPFHVNMDYQKFYKLMAPETRDLKSYNYTGDPDFKINNWVGTIVFRWEYHRGSTFFVVLNLNDSGYYSGGDKTWYRSKTNSLFLKLNYWFQV